MTENLNIATKGFVAMLDVLGFSSRILKDENQGGALGYIQIATVLAEEYRQYGIRLVLFSDKILFYTQDASPATFKWLLTVCSTAFFRLINDGIPIRGAIAYGSIIANTDGTHGTVIVGRPVIEAYRCEQQLQWIGIMLAQSTVQELNHSLKSWAARSPVGGEASFEYLRLMRTAFMLRRSLDIPIKTENGEVGVIEGYSVMPSDFPSDLPTTRPVQFMEQTANTLRELKLIAADPRSQAKYERTIIQLLTAATGLSGISREVGLILERQG